MYIFLVVKIWDETWRHIVARFLSLSDLEKKCSLLPVEPRHHGAKVLRAIYSYDNLEAALLQRDSGRDKLKLAGVDGRGNNSGQQDVGRKKSRLDRHRGYVWALETPAAKSISDAPQIHNNYEKRLVSQQDNLFSEDHQFLPS